MKKLICIILFMSALLSCGKSSSNNSGELKIIQGNTIVSMDKKWEKGQSLIVSFLDGSPSRKIEVERYAKEWMNYANIKFVFYPTLNDIPRNKTVNILITFQGQGNTSLVGTDSQTQITQQKASMVLADLEQSPINTRRAIVLHEFGHAIGLQHEHQHPERTFQLDEARALVYCKSLFGLNEESCRLHVIKTMSGEGIYLAKYDPLSIMHYSFHQDFFDGKTDIRHNTSLSLLDKLEIAKLYPGKIKRDKIIAEQNFQEIENNKFMTYKNCKIVETLVDVSRFNENRVSTPQKIKRYSIASLTDYEYSLPTNAEDKEGVIYNMKNDEYCNYEASEIEAYRTRSLEDKKARQQYGNCIIPINEDGTPISGNCTTIVNNPYQILKMNSTKQAAPYCYPSFENAVEAQKATPYCNLSSTDVSKDSQNPTQCSLENSTTLKIKNLCKANAPWFISKGEKGKKVGPTCFANPKQALAAMETSRECTH